MTNIPLARDILWGLIDLPDMTEAHKATVLDALNLMTRPKSINPSRRQRHEALLTEKCKAEIKRLSAEFPRMYQIDIARKVGLPDTAAGRVSEVLHGLHDNIKVVDNG